MLEVVSLTGGSNDEASPKANSHANNNSFTIMAKREHIETLEKKVNKGGTLKKNTA
jgi:hypothetical protein